MQPLPLLLTTFLLFLNPKLYAQSLSSTTYNFSNVTASSARVDWQSTFPGGTTYYAQISTTSIFAVSTTSQTFNLYATFAGPLITLNSNTTYYARVSTSSDQSGNLTLGSTVTLPTAPGLGSPVFTTVEVSSITANWTAGSNPNASDLTYTAERSSAAFPNAFAGNTSVSLSSLSQLFGTGGAGPALTSNTTYFFQVRANNASGSSAFASLGSTSTLANPPTSLAPSGVTASAIQANWDANSNPTGTLYEAQISSTGFPGVLSSTNTTSTSFTFGALSANTTHYLRVRAQNNNNLYTPYTTLPGAVTLPTAEAPPPANVQFTSVQRSSVSLSWSLDSPSAERPTALLATDSGFTAIVSTGTGAIGEQTTTYLNLTPNTRYYFKVKVSTASDSQYSSAISTYTLAAAPGPESPSLIDVFNSSFSSLTLQWTSGTVSQGFNPASTDYEAHLSTASDFTGTLISSRTSNLSATFIYLTAGTTYYARVGALNFSGIASSFTTLGSTAPFIPTFSQQEPVVLIVDNGNLRLTIEPDTFTSSYTLRVNLDPISQPQASPSLPSKIIEALDKLDDNKDERKDAVPGKIIEIVARSTASVELGDDLRKPLTLSMTYEEQNDGIKNLPTLRPKTLALYYLHESLNLWIRLPTSGVDLANRTVTASLPHLSVFALIGKLDTSLAEAYAFPVPFQPSLGHQKIIFVNLSQPATIRIFTVSGRLVQTLNETDGDGLLEWDARNAEGSNVASGVYFYLLESATDRKTGKLMILR